MAKSKGYEGPLEQTAPCQWRIPRSYRDDMRVDGLIFADDDADRADQEGPGARAGGQRRDLAGHPEGQPGDARHPLGVRLLHRRRRGDRPGGGGRDLAGRRRLRHQLRRPPAPHRTSTGTTSRPRSGRSSTSSSATSPPASASAGVLVQQAGTGRADGRGGLVRRRARASASSATWSSPRPAAGSTAPTPDRVSDRAFARGADQCGTLGSGNHFLEVQVVDRVLDERGRRGHGPARGADHRPDPLGLARAGLPGLRRLPRACSRTPRRSMDSSFPTGSSPAPRSAAPRGRPTSGAMRAAANFAWCNRQLLTHQAREVFARIFGKPWEALGLDLVYDVAHNIAKFEDHDVGGGGPKQVCVHRKGATRAFPPGHPEIPEAYAEVGQPVIIPGSMGTASWVLAGQPGSMIALVRHELPRGRSDDEPDRRRQAGRGPPHRQGAGRDRASSPGPGATRGSPRSSRRLTRTSTRSSTSSTRPASPRRSPGCGRSASSRVD